MGEGSYIWGSRFFELSNHLGNVLATLQDRMTVTNASGLDYFDPVVVSAQDYYAFEMMMLGRTYSAPSGRYRYGFNGHEKLSEIKSVGNSYTAQFWEYDPRIGWWNVDPIFKEYESPYAAFANNPIWFVDPKGSDTTINGVQHLDEVVVVGIRKKYQVGNVSDNSEDDDLSKTFHDININTSLFDRRQPYARGAMNRHLSRFSFAFKTGISFESISAQEEALSLLSNFETGGGKQILFDKNSSMSKILGSDEMFINMVQVFEGELLEHFRGNSNLNGFNGNGILAIARKRKYIKDTWYMHTVLGGSQQVDAQIRVLGENEIKIMYTIWDDFGTGTNDAASPLAGLPSMY